MTRRLLLKYSRKVVSDKSEVKVFRAEERTVCEVLVKGRQLEHVSEYKYLIFELNGGAC